MWIIDYETWNFSFTAIGQTEAGAFTALQNGVTKHNRQYSGRLDIDRLGDGGDLRGYEVAPGQCLRDREVIHG